MSLRHLIAKKVNLDLCFGDKNPYIECECKHLKRQFLNAGMSRELYCMRMDRRLAHSKKINDCPYYEEGK